MEYTIFSFGTTICIVLSLIMVVVVLRGLKGVLKRRGDEEGKQKTIVNLVGGMIVVWAVGISSLAAAGFFYNFDLPPRFLMIFVVSVIGMLVLTFNKRFTAFLEHVPPQWLINVQFFRVPVEIMLWILFLEGITPEQMTFEGRNWDILVGITGPICGYLCFKKQVWGRKAAIWWNIGGLALLMNILVVAILSIPTPLRVFMNEPANTAVAQFPMVLLPAILVVIAFSMHFFSLRQLTIHKNMFNN